MSNYSITPLSHSLTTSIARAAISLSAVASLSFLLMSQASAQETTDLTDEDNRIG